MKNIKLKYGLIVIALIQISLMKCASTKIVSQVNPEFIGHSFTTVLVYANFNLLNHRKLAEKELCAELTKKIGCKCFKSLDVFFPGQTFSSKQISERLIKLKIEGIVIIQPLKSGVSSIHVPGSTYTTTTADIFGNTITGSSSTYTTPGYKINKPWSNYEAMLWSVKDSKVAWYATESSKGNGFANWDDLIKSATHKTVKNLSSSSIFR